MSLRLLFARLGSFFFSLKTSQRSVPFINRMATAVIYVVCIVFYVIFGTNYWFDLNAGGTSTAAFLLSFVGLVTLALIVLWTTRRLELARIFIGLCVVLVIVGQMIDGGGVFGLGVLYLMFGFSVAYLLFGLKLTVFFIFLYLGALFLRLKFGSFPPTSIYNTPGVANRMLLILSIATALQTTICICTEVIIQNLVRLAFFDRVTALPNRYKITSLLQERIQYYQRKKFLTSIVTIKTVNLNKINSMLGNTLADQLLASIGKRLKNYSNGTVAAGRWSSSVFVLIVNLHEKSALERYSTELLQLLSRPYMISGRVVSVFFNVSVSRYPEDAQTAEELVNNSISLLERSISQPGDISFYNKDIQCYQAKLFSLLDELNNADFDQDFYLVYQPKIRVSDKICMGAEVLLRWNNPKRGEIPPGEFIPIAEQSGLMHAISRWVIKRSFSDIAAMAEQAPEIICNQTFAINLSVIDLRDKDFILFLEDLQQHYCINASSIEFEITEGIMLDDDPRIAENIEKLLALKFRIAIDDFGTGYSNLAYLQRLRVHNLKIDRSFITSMFIKNNVDDAVLIDAIIAMSKSLKLQITAEGVETSAQFDYLLGKGCDLVQGFLFSKGLRPDDYLGYCRIVPNEQK